MSSDIVDIIKQATTSEDSNPISNLMNNQGFEIVIVLPLEHNIINPWDLGHIIRKNIKIRLMETRKYPYKRIFTPASNETIIGVCVPEDYDIMGNWDLGMFVKIKIAMKEMDESK